MFTEHISTSLCEQAVLLGVSFFGKTVCQLSLWQRRLIFLDLHSLKEALISLSGPKSE